METARTATAAAVAMVLWLSGTPAGFESAVPIIAPASAAEPTLSENERKRFRTVARWEREMEKKKRALNAFREKEFRDIAWGNTRKASGSVMIVLDRPLAKNLNSDQVEIEVFERWLDNDGDWRGSMGSRNIVGSWRADIHEATKKKAVVLTELPSGGPGFAPRYERERERARDWDYGSLWYLEQGEKERAQRMFNELVDTTVLRGVRTVLEEDRYRAAIEGTGVTWEKWVEDTSDYREELKQVADRRWRNLADQAMAKMPGVFDTIPDPILLVDGKYLLTSNTVQRQGGSAKRVLKRLFQTANWLVEQQLEKAERHRFQTKDIEWGNEQEPARGELVQFRTPHADPDPDKVNVEWLYTYVNEEGHESDRKWVEARIKEWISSVRRAGVFDVRLTKTPAGQSTRRTNQWTTHQRLHQEMVMAWGSEDLNRSAIHSVLASAIKEGPREVGQENEAVALLDRAGLREEQWQARRGQPDAKRQMEQATARMLATGSRNREPQDPVFVVDGVYRIDGGNEGGMAAAFRILNWVVARQLEEL